MMARSSRTTPSANRVPTRRNKKRYSITSSARAMKVGGTLSASALAVRSRRSRNVRFAPKADK